MDSTTTADNPTTATEQAVAATTTTTTAAANVPAADISTTTASGTFADIGPFYVREPSYNWRKPDRNFAVDISPTVVGCFSRNDAGEYVDDNLQRQVYCPPETDVVSFDLNHGYETWIRRNNPSLDGLLRWLMAHGDVDPVSGYLTSKSPIADLICCRSFIVRLLGTPYEASERSPGWKVAICRYNGVLYADDSKGDNYRPSPDESLYRSCKFPSYVTATDRDSKPDIDAPVNDNRALLAVVKTRLGNHQFVHVTNVNCYDATTDRLIELKNCSRAPENWNNEQFKRTMLKWWAQGVLCGSENIICGIGEGNIVTQLRPYKISELPAQDAGEDAWDAEQCFNFCNKFLDHVKQTVKLDYDKAIYVFDFNPYKYNRYRKVTCRIEAATSEFAFLPSWFTGDTVHCRKTAEVAADNQTQ